MSIDPQIQVRPVARYSVQQATTFDYKAIFGDAFRIFRDGRGTFVAILIFIHLPLLLLQQELMPAASFGQFPFENIGRLLVGGLVFTILALFVSTNTNVTTGILLHGKERSFFSVLIGAIVAYPRVVIASAIVFVVTAAGTMALIIPGVIVWVFSRCMVPLIVIRQRTVFASLVGSYELVKGYWFHVLIVQLTIIAAGFCFSLLISPLMMASELMEGAYFLDLISSLALAAFAMISDLIAISMFLNLGALKGEFIGVPARPDDAASNDSSFNSPDSETPQQ